MCSIGGRRASGAFTAALALAGALLLALPAASPAATWEVQKLPFQPRYEGDSAIPSLLGISCPSSSFCVTAGLYGRIGVSSNPTGGGAAWTVYLGPKELDSGAPPPGLPPPSPHIKGVSCPAPSLCVAVTGNGDIYISSNPAGGSATWARTDIDGDGAETHLESVSCPTVSFCVAVSGGVNSPASGKILSSRDPAGGASAWQIAQLDPSFDLRGVSCASPSLCVAVGQEGRILVSSDPAGGPSAWRDAGAPGGPGHLQGIACVAGPLCVAGNAGGNLLTATDPIGRPGAWTERDGGGSVPITGISCPSATQCVAVDNNGDVLTSSDPTGGPAAWSFENVLPYVPQADGTPVPNGMFAVSCPSPSFCAIAAADGRVVTSTDPFRSPGEEGRKRKRSRHPKRPRTILAHVDNRRFSTAKPKLRMRFRFYATSKARGFLCKLDRRPYRRCKSPTHRWVGVGRHVFRVRAIGPTGLRGPAAVESFRVFPEGSRCPCVVRPLEPGKPLERLRREFRPAR